MPLTAVPRLLLRLLYAAWAWLILLLLVIPVTAGCLLIPGLERRRNLARLGSAAVLWLIGSSVRIRGKAPGPDESDVVVANHQSYLDGIIMTAVLPPQYSFLIKREMVRVPVAGLLLSRLGSRFVDRSSASHRHRSARELVEAARQGQALAVFPEGTFDREPGLKKFHMGAFRAASTGGLSIVPVIISGARDKLPSDSWLPRPGPLTVEFCPRLAAKDYADQTELMRATRRVMLERLNEPDLESESAPESLPPATGS